MLNAFIGSMEPRFVFFPIKGEDVTPARVGIPYQPLTLTTSDGERIAAWQIEPSEPRADIVYFHGNGGNLSGWLPVFASLHRLGYRVLAVDYRGYGLSSGSPTEEGVYLDAEAAVRHAHADRLQSGSAGRRPLVFWGRSLGAAVAAAATRVVTPDGLVLESGFPDKASILRTQPVLRLMNLFASYRFPTVELLQEFRKPVLVVHGDADTIIPFALGRELFEGLAAPKHFVTIEGADHNDFFDIGDRRYWPAVAQFLEKLR
jgi:fermentation-respiration switch protein FrsA (DUF1100 family)